MKICCLCQNSLNMDNFAKDSSRLDGLQPRCRQCQAKLNKEYREKNREVLHEKWTEYYNKNKEEINERARLKYPEKRD